MLIRRRLALRAALAFWLVQFGAGLLAAVSVRAIVDPQAAGGHRGDDGEGPHSRGRVRTRTGLNLRAVLCGTGGFDAAIADTVDDYYGWPIAFSMIAGAIVIGAITNGAFDPAVSFDDALLGIFSWPTLWVYLVSRLLSGIAATITFVSLADHH